MEDLELEVIKKLKAKDFDMDNGIGILTLLDNSNNPKESFKSMSEYLDKEDIDRNAIFEYAFKLSNIKPEEYEIED